MARTRTGVKITRRFLCRDKRDLLRASRMIRLYKEGKLTPKAERSLSVLLHKREHRYGKYDPKAPKPNPEELKRRSTNVSRCCGEK